MKGVDYIVVGQGIAGSLLAWELFRRGFRVKIIDNGHRSSASIIAAGILNPITGQRLVKSWELGKFLPVAKSYYQELESLLGVSFFKQREILRLFKNDYEVEQYEKRKVEKGYDHYLGDHFEKATFGNILRDVYGSFIIKEAANIDTKLFLTAIRTFFKNNDIIEEKDVDYKKIEFNEEYVSYKGIRSKKIIFCEGYKVIENPWFKDLKWEPAKGEILTLKIKDRLPSKIVNCGKWLMPIGDDLYRAGASHSWKEFGSESTESGRDDVIKELCANVLVSDKIEVIAQEAGVRPCTKDAKPYIGLHPMRSCLGIFNGFGSKGILMVPYYAKQFVDFLEKDIALDKQVSVDRS